MILQVLFPTNHYNTHTHTHTHIHTHTHPNKPHYTNLPSKKKVVVPMKFEVLDKINSSQPTLTTLNESRSSWKYVLEHRKGSLGIGLISKILPDNHSMPILSLYFFSCHLCLQLHPFMSLSCLQFLNQPP